MSSSRIVLVTPAVVFGCLIAPLVGCGAPGPGSGEGPVAETRQELLTGAAIAGGSTVLTTGTPPVRTDTSPSTVTFFSEASLSGDAVTQQVFPSSPNEAVSLVTFDTIEKANLVSRISSVRLVCGGRATQLTLIDFPNSGPLSNWWPSGKSFILECTPFQTVTANLHQVAPALADNVGSAHLLAHARSHQPSGTTLFSAVVASNWNGETFPDGATPTAPVSLKMVGSTEFWLYQDLQLDAWECGARAGYMELDAVMNQDKTFTVAPRDTWVDEGTGDAWGCRDGMKSALDTGAADAAKRLAPALASLMQLAGDHPRYYFVPDSGIWVFDIGTGGELPFAPAAASVGASVGTLKTVP
jgi:hypothetical protein